MDTVRYDWVNEPEFERICYYTLGWSIQKAREKFQALVENETVMHQTTNGTTRVRVATRSTNEVCILSYFGLLDLDEGLE